MAKNTVDERWILKSHHNFGVLREKNHSEVTVVRMRTSTIDMRSKFSYQTEDGEVTPRIVFRPM